jgi:hypothetical protein
VKSLKVIEKIFEMLLKLPLLLVLVGELVLLIIVLK